MAFNTTTQDQKGTLPSLIRYAEKTYNTVLYLTNANFVWDMAQFASFVIQVDSQGQTSTPQFRIDSSNDNRLWVPMTVDIYSQANNNVISVSGLSIGENNNGAHYFAGNRVGRYMRITCAISTSTPISITVFCSALPYIKKSSDLLSNRDAVWPPYITPTGGITSIVAQQIIAAGSPSLRRAISYLELINAGSVGTEVVVLDGASTILYRCYLAAGVSRIIRPELPFFGSYGNALQIQVLTATTLYAYIQGFNSN